MNEPAHETTPATAAAQERNGRLLLRVGAVGAALAALCCFTPAAVIVLAAVGLAGAVAWLDVALLPLLVVFLAVMVLGWLRLRRARGH